MKNCRKCHDFGDHANLEEYIRNYIKGVDSTIKCSEDVYMQRLLTCENCEKLINAMCTICGCFVLVRGIKKNLKCPYPYHDKWHEA